MNFKEIVLVNGAGLGRLILLAKTLEEAQEKLKIVNLSKELRELFSFTRLDTKIQICDTEEDALKNF